MDTVLPALAQQFPRRAVVALVSLAGDGAGEGKTQKQRGPAASLHVAAAGLKFIAHASRIPWITMS
jgi:hypothetical protein